jgi:Zn-dependent protease with chaperone function
MTDIEFSADFFDGASSAAQPAIAVWRAAHQVLELRGVNLTQAIAANDVRVGDRLASARRVIYLAGSGELHCTDHAAADALAIALGQGRTAAGVFRLEARYSIALLALLISVAVVWLGLRHGVPAVAAYAVQLIPPSLEARIGEQGLAVLDRLVFSPSVVPEARRTALRQRLAETCRIVGCPPHQLEFRASQRIGANALALPGGVLVFTDGIIQLARHDDELLAVAAHELGHVQHRHGLRLALSAAGVVLMTEVMLGDLSGIADLSGGLPLVLLQSGYTRGMEREADAYALTWMRRACLPPQRFADILNRLDPARAEVKGAALFSTHPDTRERIKVFQEQELVTSGC